MTKKEANDDNNQTYGWCEGCEKYFKQPNYVVKFNHVMCIECMKDWETNHSKEVELAKRTITSTHH